MARNKTKEKREFSENSSEKKVAIVCDWLTNVGGAEKVLLRVHRLFPEAPIYTSKYDPKGIDWFSDADVRTGWLQRFPASLRRFLGPFRQRYFSKLDLSGYDLIISVTGAEAKSVKSGSRLYAEGKPAKNPKGIHVSYCHVPTQYYWQMYDDYVKNPGFGILNPFVRFFFKLLVRPLRKADLKAAQNPDYFVTISEYAKEQIAKYYGRESVVIHPPVELKDFSKDGNARIEPLVASSCAPVDRRSSAGRRLDTESKLSVCSAPTAVVTGRASSFAPVVANAPRDSILTFQAFEYYITTSRQVNWKRLDLAVKGCMMAQRKLLVIGEGPEHEKLVKLAKGSGLVEFLPLMDKKELAKYLARAKGYIFPSLEPFGIAPVEALAAGCPVIAYAEGGAKDYILEGKNGILFDKQKASTVAEAILKFEKVKFKRESIPGTVAKFSENRFDKEMRKFIDEKTK